MGNPFTEPSTWERAVITFGGYRFEAQQIQIDRPQPAAVHAWRALGEVTVTFEIDRNDARRLWALFVPFRRAMLIRRHLRARMMARSRVLS